MRRETLHVKTKKHIIYEDMGKYGIVRSGDRIPTLSQSAEFTAKGLRELTRTKEHTPIKSPNSGSQSSIWGMGTKSGEGSRDNYHRFEVFSLKIHILL